VSVEVEEERIMLVNPEEGAGLVGKIISLWYPDKVILL
jgi:hypothetical protein